MATLYLMLAQLSLAELQLRLLEDQMQLRLII
jgi:hypothetical protein